MLIDFTWRPAKKMKMTTEDEKEETSSSEKLEI